MIDLRIIPADSATEIIIFTDDPGDATHGVVRVFHRAILGQTEIVLSVAGAPVPLIPRVWISAGGFAVDRSKIAFIRVELFRRVEGYEWRDGVVVEHP